MARQAREKPKGKAIATCSFCLKPNTEVGTLVAGPGVYICEPCIELSVEVMKTKPPLVKRISPWEYELSDQQLLATLPSVAAVSAQVERNLKQWVRKGRAQGITWARIGEALGMTRQSAWERFSEGE
jgi:hypothetical protein